MAVAASGLKRQQFAKSAFGIPLKSTTLSRTQPPAVHQVCYLTGGLAKLYRQVQNPGKEYASNEESSHFTDERGSFSPTAQVPLLAKRYRFIRILGTGCSATLIEAEDTFRPNSHHVAIKVLNLEYYALGYQESNNVKRLNGADPHDFSGTVRLLNTFSFGGHFCLVFELLHPQPLHQYFKRIPTGAKKLQLVRKVTLRLLQVLGFLQQENVIHADLKPENVLCKSEDLSSGVKVIDFGNAIHCVYDELSLYYDDFELQTLLYRAPEVVYGLPFGPEIDMWSLGCIVAELYLGEPLFFAATKEELLQKMVAVLGPLPVQVFQRGKFYSDYESYIGEPQSMLDTQSKLFRRLGNLQDYNLGSFIMSILRYNPSERLSVSDAFLHPFLAPEVAARFLLPTSSKGGTSLYNKISIPGSTYTLSPAVSSEIAADHLSSVDLLRRGTASTRLDPVPAKKPKRAIAEVAPFAPKPDVEGLNSPVDIRTLIHGKPVAGAGQSEISYAELKQKARASYVDFSATPDVVTVARSTATNIQETALSLPNPVPKSVADQSRGQNTMQTAVMKYSNTKGYLEFSGDGDISSHSSFCKTETSSWQGSGSIVNKRQSTTCSKSPDPEIGSLPSDQDNHSSALPKESHSEKQLLDSSIRTSSRSCETKQTQQGIQSSKSIHFQPYSGEASSGVRSFSRSPSSGQEICIGDVTSHIERVIEEEYSQFPGHPHRPVMSRFEHLEKMKMDAMKEDLEKSLEWRGEPDEWHCKTFADGSPSLSPGNGKTKPGGESELGKTSTTDRPSRRTRETSPTTPSNPPEDANESLNLLTPLGCSQVTESSMPQTEDVMQEATPRRTSQTLRGEGNRTSEEKTLTEKQTASECDGLMVKNIEETQNLKCTALTKELEYSSSNNQSENLSGFKDNSNNPRARNSEVTKTRRQLGKDSEGQDMTLKNDNVTEPKYTEPNQNLMKGPTEEQSIARTLIRSTETKADKTVAGGTGPTIGNPTSQMIDVKEMSRSARRSKTQAQERIRARRRLLNQDPWLELSHWWEVNPSRVRTLGEDSCEEVVGKGASQGTTEKVGVPQLQGIVDGALQDDTKSKAKAEKVLQSKQEGHCKTPEPTELCQMLRETPGGHLQETHTGDREDQSVLDKMELAKDVYKFEDSPPSLLNLPQLSIKSRQSEISIDGIRSKSDRTVKRDSGKYRPTGGKLCANRTQKNTTGSKGLQKERTLRSNSGTSQNIGKTPATPKSLLQEDSPKHKFKSKLELVTKVQTSDLGNNLHQTQTGNRTCGGKTKKQVVSRHGLAKKRKFHQALGDDNEQGARNIQEDCPATSVQGSSGKDEHLLHTSKNWEPRSQSSAKTMPVVVGRSETPESCSVSSLDKSKLDDQTLSSVSEMHATNSGSSPTPKPRSDVSQAQPRSDDEDLGDEDLGDEDFGDDDEVLLL